MSRIEQVEIAERELPESAPRDAIGEEDNPIPTWFNVSFYGMIVVGIVYGFYYTLSGWSQAGQYDAAVAAFEVRYAVEESAAERTRNVARGDATAIQAGATTFATICSACHKPDGTGLVGPSLVDSYWKYGNTDAELFASVSTGRPAGMPAWGAQLNDEKVWQVLAYMETLPRETGPGVGAPDHSAAAANTP